MYRIYVSKNGKFFSVKDNMNLDIATAAFLETIKNLSSQLLSGEDITFIILFERIGVTGGMCVNEITLSSISR